MVMKMFLKTAGFVAILISTFNLAGQDKIIGHYYDHFGNQLRLKEDSTFLHTFQFDLVYSWISGKFKIQEDTVYLHARLVFDTIRYMDQSTNSMMDSIILSMDQIPNSGFDSVDTYYNGIRKRLCVAETGLQNQNIFPIPEKLLYKNRKLMQITKEGKLHKARNYPMWPVRRRFGGLKKYHTWYLKKNPS
ncbi:MAG: hypothetical protein V4649_07510 [Bacteroidota bacterium]